eukprot:TRINITY_DN7027_c0_g1_i1.p1 TRINITY_DN7027_c0_g1~~TRINITY_DN7027_c0_g1_i1.p1  ORF type:complete len:410 (+),score=76.70 TRINITY_DN7027_c0_g1_i1:109-1230(+)
MTSKRQGKKPISLQPVEKEKEFNITDSLTLQVQMPNGERAQVGRGGLKIEADKPAAPRPEKKEKSGVVEALMENKKEAFLFEDLKMGEVIGEGSQAKVRKVKHIPTKKLLALKIISFGPDMTRKVLQTELSRCSQNGVDKHPNLVASLEAYFKEGFLMVLMEFMSYGTLQNVAKKTQQTGKTIPEEVLSAISAQILAGLNHLHTGGGTGDGIIHRDLKPSNLLVNAEGQVKISDFGVATFLSNQQKMAFTAVGSTAYMSPERVRGDGYTTACDIWAVGVTLAELACGYFPIGAGDQKTGTALFELCCIIAEERAIIQWPKDKNFSAEFLDFIGQCMIQKPEKRPSAAELMGHEFIKKHENKVDLCTWFKSVME